MNSLKDRIVRLAEGTRYGDHLGLCFVKAHDTANDIVNVQVIMTGEFIKGLRANQVRVVS